jgi:uncharacterized membrane protein
MSITFVNGYSSPVSICLVWYSPGCPSPPFEKAGWWKLDPREAGTVLYGAYGSKYFYFYAKALDGGYWGEPNRTVMVRNEAFRYCANEGIVNGRLVPLYECDTGEATDITIILAG